MWSLLWCGLGGAQARDLTLGEAFAIALESNLEVRQARLRLERSEVAVAAAAGAALDPRLDASVDVNASSSPNNDTNLGVDTLVTRSSGWSTSVSQGLPSGGNLALSWSETITDTNAVNNALGRSFRDDARLSLFQPLLSGAGPRAALFGLRSARLALTDEELAYRSSLEQLVLDVSRAYWRQVAAEESLRLAVRSREIAERSVADTQERFDEGFAGSADLHQVRRALGAARQAEVVAGAEVESAAADLRRQIGLSVAEGEALRLIDLPVVPESDPGLATVLASALEANAEWRRQRLSSERADLQFRQSRNGALPDLGISGSFGVTSLAGRAPPAREALLEAENSTWGLGARLSVPLPAREPRAAVAMAKMQRDSAELVLEAARQDLQLRVEDAVRAVARDRSRLELATQTLEVAQLGLEADQELLRDGRGSARDVVISLESLDQAQVDRLRAEIDLQASLLELQRVAGTLLASLGLE